MRYRATIIALLLLTPLFLGLEAVPVWGPQPEIYVAFATPRYGQEVNTIITLQLNVSRAQTFTTYNFTWRVTDPTGTAYTTSKGSNSLAGTFTQSVVYSRDFIGASTNYVGNYTVRIDQTAPSLKTSVATTQFEIGLTDSKTVTRTYLVSLKAEGYQNGENVTIDFRNGGSSLPSFPTSVIANTTQGTALLAWRPPASTPLGPSTVTFRGSSTLKIPSDTQTVRIIPVNMTVSGLTLVPGSLQRTQSVEILYSASYLSGIPVTSGSGIVRIVESDGLTTHFVVASYNSSIGVFRGTYRTGLSGLTGSWTINVDRNSTDDSYGNVGPFTGSSKQLVVQQAVLSVVVSPLNMNYQRGQTIGFLVSITNPDGTAFDTGGVAVVISFNGIQIANPVGLTYNPPQGWTGSYNIANGDPTGQWSVLVQATDAYGNHGQASVSTNVIAAGPPPPTEGPFLSLPLFLFLLGVVAIGSGIGGTLFWKRLIPSTLPGLPFDTLFQLMGGEIPAKSTVLILGKESYDSTELGFQLAMRSLELGRYCGVLTYTGSPADVNNELKKYGWKPSLYLEKGTLGELDCFSKGASIMEVKNPLDFGEVGVRVASMLEKTAWTHPPPTILIDSLTDLFKSSPPRRVFGFLSLLAEKVKEEGGILILPVDKATVPIEVAGMLEGLADGIIELNKEAGNKTMEVRKTFGRKVKPPPVSYGISKGRGFWFHVRTIRKP